MTRESVLARGRTAAEAGMVDSCTIRRVTGQTTNPTTGVVTPTYETVYTGPCKVQQAGGLPRDANPTPSAPVRMVYRELHLPVATSTGIRDEDRAEITSAAHDPDLVGRVFVLHEAAKSWPTARRFAVEEVTG